MKKFIILVFCIFVLYGIGFAETVTLTNPQPVDSPEASTMDWRVIRLDSDAHILVVVYRWRDINGDIIYGGDTDGWHTWRCRNVANDPETPEDETDTCFNDIFTFQIRQQDVGTGIGHGLRALIWNSFRTDVLGANNGTFD